MPSTPADVLTDPSSTSPAAPGSAYLRYPDVRGDLVVFTAADAVWAAPLSGGHAWRLSEDSAPVAYPRISPDGTQVAFTSRATGSPEVHLVPSDGTGAARRLTWWANRHTRVAGWLPDGRIIVTTGHGATLSSRDAQLWALDAEGRAELLPFGRASEVAVHEATGTTVVATMWRKEPSTWKHYQGGTAARLWISREDLSIDAPHEAHAARSWEPLRDDLLANKTRLAFVGDRLLFASDTPGEGAAITDRATGNLWSVALDGSDLRAHTHLTSEDGYLRDPASDGATIVFSSRGRLFAMDGPDDAPREIPVIVAGVGSARRMRAADPHKNLLAMRPTFDARASVVEWRGSAHVLTHRGGPSRLLAGSCGLRFREAAPLGRSPFAVIVTDELAQGDRTDPDAFAGRTGSDALALRRLDAEGEQITLDLGPVGRILHAVPSPDGTRIAIATHDYVVRVVTLRGILDPAATSGKDASTAEDHPDVPRLDSVREVGTSHHGEISDLAWSPDSRFLTWSQPRSEFVSQLMVSEVADPEPTGRALTSGRFLESSPTFTADGKHLAFVSARTFETQYDDIVFDLGFVDSQRPFLLPLERTTRDPFGPDADGWVPGGEEKSGEKAGGTAGDAHGPDGPGSDGGTTSPSADPASGSARTNTHRGAPSPADLSAPATASSAAGAQDAERPPQTTIDLEAAEERVVPFPVPSGHFTDLQAVAGGVIWLRHPAEGVLGTSRAGLEDEAPKPTLELWAFADHKVTVLAEGVDQVWVSGDGKQLVTRQGEAFVQIPADRKVEDEDPARITIDLGRLTLRVDPVLERRGMLWDNYRIMAQQYWRADMDGQDWHAMVSWYDEVVDRLVTADDFADMMWEVVAELGTSHAYVMPVPGDRETEGAPGLLGADFRIEGGSADGSGARLVIARILRGDSSDPDARSPLLAPGVAAREGDAIVQIGGRAVKAGAGVGPLLVGCAEKPTEIVLDRDGERRRVVVTPLADESQLRYQDWVATRRAFVAEHSDGRLGYLHIPDMVSSGWAQMHRDLREASAKEGLVVDVRYNNGGHTSQLVTDRLARRVVSWDYPRGEQPSTYPAFAPRGPVVFVTNQEAGSDGDIVGAVAKSMKIGPLIGTRTWGGVIGIDGRFDLVDGTGVTEPKYASWFAGVDWTIENYGVDPDIEVPFPPNEWLAGKDPQLSRGIEEALASLEQTPAAAAPPLPPARFGGSEG
ncbi:PDZ domain-containing protein [Brachybacterium sp. MASK1Z-5]|uniref:PDZ domain-containing protein n=1 Tax=Brachybacterium halotolerans TaxID=2795215 RepID=A0ABS1BAW6_9MICO|nr:S41 family peptidase [Brachybacterium halotolerans]MBK0331302.1 PDZ domain-containing protein [Brachybacterium halotolerans]